jgi:hypothetical protein
MPSSRFHANLIVRTLVSDCRGPWQQSTGSGLATTGFVVRKPGDLALHLRRPLSQISLRPFGLELRPGGRSGGKSGPGVDKS